MTFSIDMDSALQLPGGLIQKTPVRDNEPLMGALPNGPSLIVGGYLKKDALAVHFSDFAFSLHLQT